MLKNFMGIAVSILFVFVISSVGAQNKPATTPETPTAQQEMKTMDRAEGEIQAFLVAVDEHEIAAAKDASQKTTNPEVRKYAEMMIRDHEKHLTATQQLTTRMNIQPRETPDIDQLKTEAEAARKRLEGLQGAAFDKAYIEEMVKDHGDALNRIDNHYMKATTDAEFLNHLKKTRTAVAKHHEEAQRIQGTLK
jgi:putative membrane protein